MQVFQLNQIIRCKFHLVVDKEDYIKYSNLIKEHGGIVCSTPGNNITFTSESNRLCQKETYRLEYITDCIKQKKLLNVTSYGWRPECQLKCGLNILLFPDEDCSCFSSLYSIFDKSNSAKLSSQKSLKTNDVPEITVSNISPVPSTSKINKCLGNRRTYITKQPENNDITNSRIPEREEVSQARFVLNKESNEKKETSAKTLSISVKKNIEKRRNESEETDDFDKKQKEENNCEFKKPRLRKIEEKNKQERMKLELEELKKTRERKKIEREREERRRKQEIERENEELMKKQEIEREKEELRIKNRKEELIKKQEIEREKEELRLKQEMEELRRKQEIEREKEELRLKQEKEELRRKQEIEREKEELMKKQEIEREKEELMKKREIEREKEELREKEEREREKEELKIEQERERAEQRKITQEKIRLNIRDVKIVCEKIKIPYLENSKTENSDGSYYGFKNLDLNQSLINSESNHNIISKRNLEYSDSEDESIGIKRRKVINLIDSEDEFPISKQHKENNLIDNQIPTEKKVPVQIESSQYIEDTTFSQDSCLQGRSTLKIIENSSDSSPNSNTPHLKARKKIPSVYTQVPIEDSYDDLFDSDVVNEDFTNVSQPKNNESAEDNFLDSLEVFPPSLPLTLDSVKSHEMDQNSNTENNIRNEDCEQRIGFQPEKSAEVLLNSQIESHQDNVEDNLNSNDLLDEEDREALLKDDSETEFENTSDMSKEDGNQDSDIEIIVKDEPIAESTKYSGNGENESNDSIQIIEITENNEERTELITHIEKQSQHFTLEISSEATKECQLIKELLSDELSDAETIKYSNANSDVGEGEILLNKDLLMRKEEVKSTGEKKSIWDEFLSDEDNDDTDKENLEESTAIKENTDNIQPKTNLWGDWLTQGYD